MRIIRGKVNLENFQVEEVNKPFEEMLPSQGYRSNGQHMQLPGHALFDVSRYPDGLTVIKLWHPKTLPQTGHVDVFVEIREDAVSIQNYTRGELKLYPGNSDLVLAWPHTDVFGGSHLLLIFLAIEGYLKKKTDGQTGLFQWILGRLSIQHKQTESLAPTSIPAI